MSRGGTREGAGRPSGKTITKNIGIRVTPELKDRITSKLLETKGKNILNKYIVALIEADLDQHERLKRLAQPDSTRKAKNKVFE